MRGELVVAQCRTRWRSHLVKGAQVRGSGHVARCGPCRGAQTDGAQVQDAGIGQGAAGKVLEAGPDGGAQPLQDPGRAGVTAAEAVGADVVSQEGGGAGQVAYEVADAVGFQHPGPPVGLLKCVEHFVAQQVAQGQQAELVGAQVGALARCPLAGVDGLGAVVLAPLAGVVITQAAGVVGGAGAGGHQAGNHLGVGPGTVAQPRLFGAFDSVVLPGVAVGAAHALAVAGTHAMHAVTGDRAPGRHHAAGASLAYRLVSRGELVRLQAGGLQMLGAQRAENVAAVDDEIALVGPAGGGGGTRVVKVAGEQPVLYVPLPRPPTRVEMLLKPGAPRPGVPGKVVRRACGRRHPQCQAHECSRRAWTRSTASRVSVSSTCR